MFKLMTSRLDAIDNAHKFAACKMSGRPVNANTVGKTIAAHTKFPCLIEWFANFDWRNQLVLDHNQFSKADAKCLVYPKTNKSIRISQLVLQSDANIRRDIKESGCIPTGWRSAEVIRSDGFVKVLEARESPDEPFLIKIRLIRKDNGNNNYMRISVMNLNTAKQLVYHTKNNRHKFGSFRPSWGEIKIEYSNITDTGPEGEADMIIIDEAVDLESIPARLQYQAETAARLVGRPSRR